MASNGVDLQALLAGDTSQLSDSNLVDKFKVTRKIHLIINNYYYKDFIQQNETLKAFVLDVLNHFGIQVPRIDWEAIGSTILDTIPVLIQYVPTIISVISLFGK